MEKQAQKTTSVIYPHVHFCFHTVCVDSSGKNYGQELLEAQLHLTISTTGARQQGRGIQHLPGYSWPPEMPLGLASGDKRNCGVKPSVSEQYCYLIS